jgi:hypothetical protein
MARTKSSIRIRNGAYGPPLGWRVKIAMSQRLAKIAKESGSATAILLQNVIITAASHARATMDDVYSYCEYVLFVNARENPCLGASQNREALKNRLMSAGMSKRNADEFVQMMKQLLGRRSPSSRDELYAICFVGELLPRWWPEAHRIMCSRRTKED